jgi:formylglycine-generating enzyme
MRWFLIMVAPLIASCSQESAQQTASHPVAHTAQAKEMGDASSEPLTAARATPATGSTVDQHEAGAERDDNGLKMNLVWCPPGKFAMGRPMDGGYESFFVEFQAPVTLTNGFWIGKYEVTQGQWEAIMTTKPWAGKTFSGDIGRAKEGANYPVVWLTWNEAVEFCTKFTEAERSSGRITENEAYVLPTEAQWEYACRAGTTTLFSFGNDRGQLSKYCWWGALYGGNATGEPYAHLVGTKLANEWGLHDMHGNAYEMCSDLYEDKIKGGIDPVGATSGTRRVIRGGSWYSEARDCRTTIRGGWPPYDNEPFIAWHEFGFRVARVWVR